MINSRVILLVND